jgi:competence protein ComEA
MKTMTKAGIYCMLLTLALVLAPALHADESGKVNVNKATLEELTEVKFIGPAIAEGIVEHREESGPFEALEDLMEVKGIGPKTFDKIKDSLTL